MIHPAVLSVGFPEILSQADDVLRQVRRHAHADAKRNRSLGAGAAIFIVQPLHQFLLPARRIPTEVILLHGRRQCLKGVASPAVTSSVPAHCRLGNHRPTPNPSPPTTPTSADIRGRLDRSPALGGRRCIWRW